MSFDCSNDSPYEGHDRPESKIRNHDQVVLLILYREEDGSNNKQYPIGDVEERQDEFILEIILEIFDIHLLLTKYIKLNNNNQTKTNKLMRSLTADFEDLVLNDLKKYFILCSKYFFPKH